MILWQKADDGWRAHEIGAAAFLTRGPEARWTLRAEFSKNAKAVVVRLPGDSRSVRAALIPAPGVRVAVEGFPALSFQLLRDRDEISVEGARLPFRAYEAPKLWRYRGDERETCCGRCKRAFSPGDPATSCGFCRTAYHVAESRFQERIVADVTAGNPPTANASDVPRDDDAARETPCTSASTMPAMIGLAGEAGADESGKDCDTISDQCAGCMRLRSRALLTPDDEEALRDA